MTSLVEGRITRLCGRGCSAIISSDLLTLDRVTLPRLINKIVSDVKGASQGLIARTELLGVWILWSPSLVSNLHGYS